MRAIEEKVGVLKDNFTDCTIGDENDEYVSYDIGLEDTFAHVDVYKEENKIAIKVFDPDSNLLGDNKCKYVHQAVDYLNISTWRKIWNRRRKLTCASTKEQIENWTNKHQKEYDETIYIDKHPKDDWVAYLLPEEL